MVGCFIVVAGAYLVSIDAKAKQKAIDSIKYQNLGIEAPINEDNFIVGFLKALWSFKAGLFMMGVSFCW